MKIKKIVTVCTTIGLIGLACLICYFVFLDNGSTDIIISDDKEERVIKTSDIDDSNEAQETLAVNGKATDETVTQEECITVHVCGQVKKPGVYSLAKGARVDDAIEAAGGLTKEAAGDFINQAQKLEDEQKVYVPDLKEAKQKQNSMQVDEYDESHSVSDSLININQASREDLMTLPGIGKAKADMIITYREEHGRFATIEEIKNISGIKDGVYNKICDLIKTD